MRSKLTHGNQKLRSPYRPNAGDRQRSFFFARMHVSLIWNGAEKVRVIFLATTERLGDENFPRSLAGHATAGRAKLLLGDGSCGTG